MSFRLLEEFIEKIKLFGLEFFGRYYSIYRAIVVDNKDDEYKGRIRIQIDEFGSKPYPYLAMPKFQLMYKDKGIYIVPDIGDYVWVSFQNGDARFPIYEGNNNLNVFEVPDEFKTNYPNRRGIKTKAGHTIFIDDTEGKETIVVKHKDNSYFMFDKDGGIVYGTEGGNYFYMDKKSNIQIRIYDGSGLYISNGQISIINKDGNILNIGGSGIDMITSNQVSVFGNSILLGVGANMPATGGGVYKADAEMITKLGVLLTSITALSTAMATYLSTSSPLVGSLVDPSAKAIVTALNTMLGVMQTTLISIQEFITYLQTQAPSKSVMAKN